jgi:DNA processing protein
MVIEAGRKSGALITAKIAAEDHGREVFALPARVDSTASHGSLDLIKAGGALMVTHPDDILAALESPARHAHEGTHTDRYLPFAEPAPGVAAAGPAPSSSGSGPGGPGSPSASPRDLTLTPSQSAILAALDGDGRSIDDLTRTLSLEPGTLRSDLTILEIRRRVERKGSLIVRRG